MPSIRDAVVVGAGPNGLTAAVELARRGFEVELFEALESVGGGARTEELTLPGFWHDPCSAVHPTGAGSPAFRAAAGGPRPGVAASRTRPWPTRSPTARRPCWRTPSARPRSPSGPGTRGLPAAGRPLHRPLGRTRPRLARPRLGPQRAIPSDPVPARPLRPGGLQPVTCDLGALPRREGRGAVRRSRRPPDRAAGRAVHRGRRAHLPIAGHAVGWPFARGGSQAISNALAGYCAPGRHDPHRYRVNRLGELPPARAYLFDTSPTGARPDRRARQRLRQLPLRPGRLQDRLRAGRPRALELPGRRAGRRRAPRADPGEIGTAHVAGRRRAGARNAVPHHRPAHPRRPRPGPGRQTCLLGVRARAEGWDGDATAGVERQLERFAPGFPDRVLARAATGRPNSPPATPTTSAATSPAARRPDCACCRPGCAVPYATAHPSVFLCSSAAPPGPGVHGMAGHHAARAVWRRLRRAGAGPLREGPLPTSRAVRPRVTCPRPMVERACGQIGSPPARLPVRTQGAPRGGTMTTTARTAPGARADRRRRDRRDR